MYKKEVEKYDKCGLTVVPLMGKRPLVANWTSEHIDMYELAERYADANIGLVLGKVVAIDIDVEEEGFKREIEQILERYPTPVRRRGKRSRLATCFYLASEGGVESRRLSCGIELLSVGRQCVMPPSLHPEGYSYEWESLDLVFAYQSGVIPEFDMQMWHDLESLCIRLQGGLVSIADAAESGRHNKLVSMCFAMLEKGKHPSEIAQELLSEDLRLHGDRAYFLDREETHGGKGLESARAMVRSVARTYVEKAVREDVLLNVKLEEGQGEEKERLSYPRFSGVMREIYDAIVLQSPIKRPELAVGATLATWSVLLANKFFFKNQFTNAYVMLVAHSAQGKDFPLKFAKRLLFHLGLEHLVGLSAPSGDVATFAGLTEQSVRIDTYDEMAKLFLSGNNESYARTLSTYLELYTSTGQWYEGKPKTVERKHNGETITTIKKVGRCFAPCVSVIGAMTPTHFQEAMSSSLIEHGHGGRFLYFFDTEFVMPSFDVSERFEVSDTLRQVARLLYPKDATGFQPMQVANAHETQQHATLQHAYRLILREKEETEVRKAFEHIAAIRARYAANSVMSNITSRLVELFYKLLILSASSSCLYVLTQQRASTVAVPQISVADVQFALQFIEAYVQRVQQAFSLLTLNGQNNSLRSQIIEVLKEADPNGLSIREIYRKKRLHLHFGVSRVKQEIATLVQDTVVLQVSNSPARFSLSPDFHL